MTTATQRPETMPHQDDSWIASSRMSFGDHLEDLRIRLVRALIGVVLAAAVALYFGKEIVVILLDPLLMVQQAWGLTPSLQVLAPTTAFLTYLKVSFLTGLIVSMPWVILQIWGFIATGLYSRERRFVRIFAPASVGLFALGVLFLYFIVLPVVLNFFIGFNQKFGSPTLEMSRLDRMLVSSVETKAKPTPAEEATSNPDGVVPLRLPVLKVDPVDPQPGDAWISEASKRLVVMTKDDMLSVSLERGPKARMMQSQFALDFYTSFVLLLALAFGLAFETPIAVFLLARTGIIPTAAMARGRRYVLLGTVIAAAVMTPPDVVSQLLLAGPMYVLFEVGLLAARLTDPKEPAESAASGID